MSAHHFDNRGKIVVGSDVYSFASRQALQPAGLNVTAVATSTKNANGPILYIPLVRGQAARVIVASALFLDPNQSGKLIMQHAYFQLTNYQGSNSPLQVYAESATPGAILASSGYGITMRDELFLSDDYKEFSAAGTVVIGLHPLADVQNTDTVAQTIGCYAFALFELYNLESPALRALPRRGLA